MHQPATPAQVRIVTGVTLLYLLAAAIGAWALSNGEFVFYIVVMAVLIVTLVVVHRRVGLSIGVLVGLSFWGLLHMAGGLVPIPEAWHSGLDESVLYNLWFIPHKLKYDQVVHAWGFGITTWLCWQGFCAAARNQQSEPRRPLLPTSGLLILCAAAGMGFGALNEVIEFIATLLLPKTNVGGYENTSWDLVFNLIGATIAALIIAITGRRSAGSGMRG